MAILTTYLKKISFDAQLNNSLIAKYLRNVRLVILVIAIIIVLGIISFFSIPRVLNPSINIAIVNIATVLPGAGPDEVESLVTVPIERAVGNVANIDTMTSVSQNSSSIVTIQFNTGVDANKAESDIQTAVQTVNNLPKDATTPSVQKLDFQNAPIWIFSVSAHDPASLVRFSRGLRDTLKDVQSVNQVATDGLDTQEIQVLIKPDAIARYGINPAVVSQSVTTAMSALPGGNIITDSSSFSLTIDPTITSVNDLRNLRISLSNGISVLLSDIATVSVTIQPGSTTSYSATPEKQPSQSVTFSIFKKSSANITTADQDAHAAVAQFAKRYSGQVQVATVLDTGSMINRQFNELVKDLIITFILVFIVILIFLGTRQAIIAASAIPLTFLITFTVMHATQIDLSFIAFFSLLLALGLLVDDTIVVISALSSYYRTGKFTPLEAGLLVWRDFRTAVFTTTLTTVWAFVPLLLSTGIIGEFIKPIPIVVSSALLSSFGVAMFITLPLVIIVLRPSIPHRVVLFLRILTVCAIVILCFVVAPKGIFAIPAVLILLICIAVLYMTRADFIAAINALISRMLRAKKKSKNKKFTFLLPLAAIPPAVYSRQALRQYFDRGIISFDKIGFFYKHMLHTILISRANRRKTLIIVLIFSFSSYLLLPLGFVRNEFFPASSQEVLTISLEMPAGTKIAKTQQESLSILNDVRRLPEVQLATLAVGSGPTTNGFNPGGNGSNVATITLVLPPTAEQRISSIDLAARIRNKYAGYRSGKLSVIEESGGPPAGADLQIKLFGSDLALLDMYATKIETYLNTQQGVTNVDKSVKSGTSKIVFTPDYQKMLDAGITEDQVGMWLHTYASGFTLNNKVTIEQGNSQEQDIVFRTSPSQETADNLSSFLLPTQNGPLPLSALGTLTLKPNPTLITRENQKRTISVTGSVTKGFSVSQKNADLEKFANSLNLPEGYSWSTGGVNQQNQESVNSIVQAMILSFLLIIITMVLQFSSFRKAFIVMLVIPLSISGVFIVFSLTNTPLSFPAIIGILALFGIVVKNSILVVDKINQDLRAGIPFVDAIVDAAESRLEPIALTSFTAIIGLIPITLSNALWQGLGGAIISGLFFSGTIMLFFIPVVYFYLFQPSEGKNAFRH